MKVFAVCFMGEVRKGSIFASAMFCHRDDAEDHAKYLNDLVGQDENQNKPTYFVKEVVMAPDLWIVA